MCIRDRPALSSSTVTWSGEGITNTNGTHVITFPDDFGGGGNGYNYTTAVPTTPGPHQYTAIVQTSAYNGGCLNYDTVNVQVDPAAIVNAGKDTTVCGSTISVPLNGSYSGATTGIMWSTTGTGSFSPNNTTLNASYILSAGDRTSDSIKIYIMSANDLSLIHIFTISVAVYLFCSSICR